MVANFTVSAPRSVRETIKWLLRLGRPPLPECPLEAAKLGRQQKQPQYFDGRRVVPVEWKDWQHELPIPEVYEAWFRHPKTGIGTLGGWNGKHWLAWVDFDAKDFESLDFAETAIAHWVEQYPVMDSAPMFRTPGGGWRFLIAFDKEPESFKANNGFSLAADGSQHAGELLTKNGGHTLLPPTVGANGRAYRWERWAEYPPVVGSPGEVGLYPVIKRTQAKSAGPVKTDGFVGDNSLVHLLEREIYPRLAADQAFHWHGHNFKEYSDRTLKGYCPWHESKSGTSFYVDRKQGSDNWVWRCPACGIGGGVIEYRHRLAGGDGSPRGAEFVELVKTLAEEVGASLPEHPKSTGRSYGSSSIGGGGGRGIGGGNGGNGGDDGGNGKVVRFPGFDPLALEKVIARVDELIQQGVTGSQLTGQLNRLAAASQMYIGELRKLYCDRLGEADLEDSRAESRSEVENLLKLGSQSLDLYDYLPEDLASPLTVWCNWLKIEPVVILTALLTGISSLHRVGTELVLHRNQNFRVPPTIFSALVSESGQRKSPIFTNIIRQPLAALRQEKIEVWQAAMEDYESELEAWEAAKGEGVPKPEKPKDPTLYYFTNATGEAIPVQASKDPEKALLALIDELSGLFKSENSYRSGRGSDKQDLLSYYDGLGQTVLRASGVKVDLEKLYLSVFGTIQPDVIKAHMGDCSDPDGQWARFLFVLQSTVPATLEDDDGQAVSVRDRIADYYRKVDRLPEMEYRLSKEAFKLYQPVYNQLERLRVSHPKQGMRAVYSKMEGYVGRLALNLHVLWELAQGSLCPSEEIPAWIMETAIQLAKFYLGQIQVLHALSDDEELPTRILKLLELSKRREVAADGWVKAKQYQLIFSKKSRPCAENARQIMLEAVAMGKGQVRGEGNRLEFHWRSNDDSPVVGSVGSGRLSVGSEPTAENLEIKGIEETVGSVGESVLDDSLRKEPILASLEEEREPTDLPNSCNEEIIGDSAVGSPAYREPTNAYQPTKEEPPKGFWVKATGDYYQLLSRKGSQLKGRRLGEQQPHWFQLKEVTFEQPVGPFVEKQVLASPQKIQKQTVQEPSEVKSEAPSHPLIGKRVRRDGRSEGVVVRVCPGGPLGDIAVFAVNEKGDCDTGAISELEVLE